MNKLHDIGWLVTGRQNPTPRVTDAKSHNEAAVIYNNQPAPEPTIERVGCDAEGRSLNPVCLGVLGVGTTPIEKPEGW